MDIKHSYSMPGLQNMYARCVIEIQSSTLVAMRSDRAPNTEKSEPEFLSVIPRLGPKSQPRH